MQSTNATIRRVACTVALALTALAAVATVAASGSDASGNKALSCKSRAQACMSAAEYRAVLIRSAALNRKYGLGATK